MDQETANGIPEAGPETEVWWSGGNLLRVAAIVFAAGWTPQLIYSAVVPEHGNPAMLVLLAFSATVVALGLGTASVASAFLGRSR